MFYINLLEVKCVENFLTPFELLISTLIWTLPCLVINGVTQITLS